MNATNPVNDDGMGDNELGRMSSIIVMKILNGNSLRQIFFCMAKQQFMFDKSWFGDTLHS